MMKELVTLIKHNEFAKAKRLLKKALQTEPDNVYLLTQIIEVWDKLLCADITSHGEGLRWAKTLQRDAKEVLEVCMKEKNKRGL